MIPVGGDGGELLCIDGVSGVFHCVRASGVVVIWLAFLVVGSRSHELRTATPAGGGLINSDPASLPITGGDDNELASRRIRLPEFVVAPADGVVVGSDSARMLIAGRDGSEQAFRRSCAVTPADGSFIGPDTARMLITGSDGSEQAFRRVCLPMVVVAPAGDSLIGSDPARIIGYRKRWQ